MKEKQKTPLDFCQELLDAWTRNFIEGELYKEWGMSYTDAMAQVYLWRNGELKDNLDMLKQFHRLLGLAIDYLEKKK